MKKNPLIYMALAIVGVTSSPAADQFFSGSGTALDSSSYGSTAAGPFTSAFVNGSTWNYAGVTSGTGTGGTISMGGLAATQNFTLSSASGTVTLTGTANIATGMTVNLGTQTIAGSAITKLGAGRLTLSGSNSFSGTTTLTAGVIRATTNAAALGTSVVDFQGSGTLELANDTALNFGRTISIGASSSLAAITSDRLTSGAGVTQSLGALTIGSKTLTIRAGSNVSSGTAGVTFTGNTSLSGATPIFAVQSGALLTLTNVTSGNPASVRTITTSGAGDMIITGSITTGVGAVSQGGSGRLTLTGTNTYSGGTTINAGTLQVNNDSNLGAAAGTVTFGGGTLAVASGSTTISRATTLNAGGGSINVMSNNSQVTWSGTISGVGALTKSGTAATASVLYLTGSNTYQGGTIIKSGILRINSDSNLGNASGSVTFDNGTSTARLITTFSTTSNRSIILNGNGSIATEQLAPETPNVTVWNGAISGTGSLDKRFAGTLMLTANNTYSGATTVTTGALIVGVSGSGSLSNTTGVTVSNGALLGGSGTIAGAVTMSGTSFLAPGNSPGTLTINNNLTLSDTSTVQMELSGTGAGEYDSLAVSGTLSMNGTIALSFINGFEAGMGDTFTLFSGWNGAMVDNGFAFDFSQAVLTGGLSWDTSSFLNDGTIAVVPEPSQVSLMVLGLGLVLWGARRRFALKS